MLDPEDVMGDAVERLEWDERKEEDSPSKRMRQMTRRTALTGGAAGIAALALEACGGSSSGTSFVLRRDQQRQQRGLDLRGKCQLQVHVGQPRDDEPVLHPDPERRVGRVQAARLQLSVDGLRDEQRLGDGQRDEQRDQRQGQRDRRRADLQHRVQRADNNALAAGIPVVAYNADVAGNNRLAYIGQDLLGIGPEDGRAHRCPRSVGQRGAVHRHAGFGQHPAADRRGTGHAQEPLGHQGERGRDRSGNVDGAHDDQRVRGRAPEREGDVRGRRAAARQPSRRRSRSTA